MVVGVVPHLFQIVVLARYAQAFLCVVRPLYYYYNVKKKAEIDPLIQYILSPDGQDIIKKSGYIPVK